MKMKKIVKRVFGIPNYIYNKMVLTYRHVKYGTGLKIHGRIFCVSNSKDGIVIGNNVSINSGKSSNPIGGDTQTTLFAKGSGKIRIGDDCGMSNVTIFATESITIGNHVLLGGSVKIYDTDFHWLNIKERLTKEGGVTKPVEIKDGAFIGAHSIVLKGVTVGKASIVGAGSVVTKSIPDGEIWAGNPARFIRKVEEGEA